MLGTKTPDVQFEKSFVTLNDQADKVITESENALSVFQITVDDLGAKNSTMKKQIELIKNYQLRFTAMETKLQQKVDANKTVIDRINEFFLPKNNQATK